MRSTSRARPPGARYGDVPSVGSVFDGESQARQDPEDVGVRGRRPRAALEPRAPQAQPRVRSRTGWRSTTVPRARPRPSLEQRAGARHRGDRQRGSAPRSNRMLASVFSPSFRSCGAPTSGLKRRSRARWSSCPRDLGFAPPMTPAMATGRSASAMTSISGSACASGRRASASSRPAPAVRRSAPAGKHREVEGVHRLAELEQHVVRDIDDVADRADAGGAQPRLHPVGRRPTLTSATAPRSEAQVGRFDDDVDLRAATGVRPSGVRPTPRIGPLATPIPDCAACGLTEPAVRSRRRTPWPPRVPCLQWTGQSGRLAVTSKSITASSSPQGSMPSTANPRSDSVAADLVGVPGRPRTRAATTRGSSREAAQGNCSRKRRSFS
jgi:hypothetical protein